MDRRNRHKDGLFSSENFFRLMVDRLEIGCAHCRMLYRGEVAVDWLHLEVNSFFLVLTGLTEVVGRRASELFPHLRATSPDVVELFERVVRLGGPETLETYVPALGSWLFLDVFGLGQDEFVVTFKDVSQRP